MYDLITDYSLFLILGSFFLFGLIILFYSFRKKEFIIGVCTFFIWLVIALRFCLFPLIIESFDERFRKFIYNLEDIITSITVLMVPVLIIYFIYVLFKKRFVHALVVFLFIFPAHFSYVESYFIFYPLIDTRKSSKFTLRRFDMIRPGMTKEQVRSLIGNPVKDAGQYHAPCEGQTGDSAVAPYYDFVWLNSSVCYDESDLVIETKKNWIPD